MRRGDAVQNDVAVQTIAGKPNGTLQQGNAAHRRDVSGRVRHGTPDCVYLHRSGIDLYTVTS